MQKKRSRFRREAPPIGALLRYQARIVRVVAEARGQRAMIESLDTMGRTFISTVKWGSLRELGAQRKDDGCGTQPARSGAAQFLRMSGISARRRLNGTPMGHLEGQVKHPAQEELISGTQLAGRSVPHTH
jgi:hypothetical protein